MSKDKSENRTSEPLWLDNSVKHNFPAKQFLYSGSMLVAEVSGNGKGNSGIVARRMRDCWNKLANHPDLEAVEIVPKGTIEALRHCQAGFAQWSHVARAAVIEGRGLSFHATQSMETALTIEADDLKTILSRADAQKGGK